MFCQNDHIFDQSIRDAMKLVKPLHENVEEVEGDETIGDDSDYNMKSEVSKVQALIEQINVAVEVMKKNAVETNVNEIIVQAQDELDGFENTLQKLVELF